MRSLAETSALHYPSASVTGLGPEERNTAFPYPAPARSMAGCGTAVRAHQKQVAGSVAAGWRVDETYRHGSCL